MPQPDPAVPAASRAQPGSSLADGPGMKERVAGPLLLAVWFGLLGGLGEGIYTFLKGYVQHRPVGGFLEANPAVLWTSPLAVAATFAVLGLVLAGAGVIGRRLPVNAMAVSLFTGLLVYSWLMVPGRVIWVAAAVLSLGAAVQAVRLAVPRMDAFLAYARRSIPRGLALVALLAVAQLTSGPLRAWWHLRGAPQPPSATNVLLVVLDTERADRLGLYGYGRPTTPELERLARSSITFDEAYSPSGWTFPSHATMFTGRMFSGRNLGMRFRNPLLRRETTLAEVLRDAGYNTAAFSANLSYTSPQLGLGQGFLKWSGLRVTPHNLWLSGWLNRWMVTRYHLSRGLPGKLFARSADDINGDFMGWIDRRPADRPFFVFLNYFDVHSPYTAPAPFAGMFRQGTGPLWLTRGTHARSYSEEELAYLSSAYDEGIAYLDNRIGAMMDTLEARGILDNTLVIITSDHGEQFGEHGLMDHGQNLYSVLTRVPLVVRLPGGAQGGRRVPVPVGTLDLAATVLDQVGVPPGDIGGTSLSGLWSGVGSERPIYSYHDGYGKRLRSVHHRGWHYIEDDYGPAELYYLPDDPEELNDLTGSAPRSVIAQMKGGLDMAFGRSADTLSAGLSGGH